MTLAWAHGDRVWLSRVLAFAAIANLVAVTMTSFEPSAVPPHPGAPTWLLALARSHALTIVVAAIGILAAIASARRTAGLLPTIVWLVASALLVEACAAHGPGPYRGWFFVGAAGVGSLVARTWARLGGRRDLEPAAMELGVLATLAACYVGAASSKLFGSGATWADATTLRAVALAHAHVDDPELATWLAGSPDASTFFAWSTVAIQLGAIGLVLGGVPRTLAVVGIVGFHVGVAAFARIGYWSPVILVIAYGLPWPRWIAKLRTAAPDPPLTVLPRGDRLTLAILAAAIALAWLVPIRDYAEAHHRPRTLDDAGTVVSREPLEAFGPLTIGMPLPGDWRIDAIEQEPARTMIVLAHPSRGRAVLWVSSRAPNDRKSPFDRDTLRVAYEGSDASRFAAAAHRVADLLAAEPAAPRLLQ